MNLQQPKNDPLILSGRDVTAVLGPTNTGKTHLAIERMVAHESGLIGLPLRLLAREVYGRVCEKVGANKVALVTGEEKILPPGAKYSVCTVEAMPRETDAAFVAIDEVQLAGDLERGHIFTDRILHLRGRQETLLLGAATMQGILQRLLRGVSVVTRPRLSHLAYSGAKKLTRLPPRSAIVAFSADEVYAIGELIRRQRGGVAVVLGALSPRTRNAQVAIYQSGDVDFLVATDAIGMGLNLDLDHVAFAQNRKFDGFQYRNLNASELGQIAGRAGRHLRDGTFGVTGRVDPFPDELVEKIESHDFDPVKVLQWRTAQFDFSSIDALKRSIDTTAPVEGLTRALPAVDSRALEHLSQDPEIRALATGRERVARLWEVCALPDYRKIAPAQHSELVASIYLDIARHGHVDENYMAEQVRRADTVEGDIDTLSHRIAQIRTWTYVSNRPGWLADPQHWQQKTREIEDRLSDALHERLTKRFVDRRTSVLMRRLRENTMLEAEISPAGTVLVEGHHVGELQGFRFTADQSAGGEEGKAIKAAAQKALALEFESRAERFSASGNNDIALGSDGILRWIGAPIGTLAATEDALRPRIILLADEQLTGPARDKVAARAERFVNFQIETALKPLIELKNAEQLSGIARGIAFQLVEHFGLINRREIADDIKSLDQEGRAGLRRLGVRFGAYHVFVPSLLKPGPAGLVTLLWALKNDGKEKPGFGDVVHALAAGRTSVVVDPAFDRAFYKLAGFRMLGRRAVRVDILERLADLIRPALAWKAGTGPRPDGAFDGSAFLVTPAMMSILGANADDIEEILKGLGYRAEPKPAAEVKTRLEALDQAAREAAEAAAAKREAEKAAKEAEKAAEQPAGEPVEAAIVTGGDMPAAGADEVAAKAAAPSSPLAGEVSPQATEEAGDDVLGSSPSAPELTASEGEAVASEPLTSAAEAIAPVVQDEPVTQEPPAEAESSTEAVTPPLEAATWKPDAGELPADLAPIVPGPESVGEAAAPPAEVGSEGVDGAGLSETVPVAESAEAKPKGDGDETEEPKPILLWRPARFEQRPRHHRQDNRQRRGQRDGGAAGDGKAQGDRPQRSDARPPRENGGKERFERGKFRGKPNADGQRPDRRDNRPGDKGGFQGKQPFQARPPREERPVRVDPDSPFAKLAALRDQLKK
ncbi:helicase-related protein [Allomesorhizobium alhagi]|jgi:ATP-dependent RNA helicase SUPV3L1/SUV3|uniref:Helicase domain-containing protein n=1 Tax=Mesorhizobium alhagi CCNWXJ12-2 TaxID=1107882 RepID=H0HLU8_9HYPH|nr:helicase-related protein [Mesorhizobium alhagi]EHK58276.1 helicase domain-containing protein [Mesorhizobium alhagi CCNWXJ12-2]